MKQLIIKKGTKTRIVYVPGRKLRQRLQAIHPELQAAERRAAHAAGTQDVAHGFVRGRSPVTCAQAHTGFAVTVSMDLANWFDSIDNAQVADGMAQAGMTDEEANALACTVCAKGEPPSFAPHQLAPRQGMLTSPTCANLAAVAFDEAILANLPDKYVYTRYADDLIISLDEPAGARLVIEMVESVARSMNWSVAPHKTRVQYAKSGRRIIVGVAVDHDLCFPTRRARRKLRAAQHQNADSNSALGLAEWCLLRKPKPLAP